MASDRMQRFVATFARSYTTGLEILIGGLLSVMIAVGFAAVVARYLLGGLLSLYWAEEVIRYSFIWTVFLVSPLVIRRGANLELDIFVHWLPPRGRRILFLLNAVVILVFLVVLAVQGVVMVGVNRDQLSSALEISMAWVYLAVPVGGVLMLGEYIRLAGRLWRGKTEPAQAGAAVAVE